MMDTVSIARSYYPGKWEKSWDLLEVTGNHQKSDFSLLSERGTFFFKYERNTQL